MHLNKTQRVSLLLIVALLALYQAVSATPLLPMPRNMVNDSAHLYTPAETERLEALLRSYRDSTGRDIVVVTVRDLQGREINDFATRLGNDWGVGQAKEDNGVIFLIRASQMPAYALPQEVQEESTAWHNNQDNAERFKTLPTLLEKIQDIAGEDWKAARPAGDYGTGYIATGRGMEGALPDILSMRIMRDIVAPYAAAHRYAEGTEAGVYAIISTVAGDQASLSQLGELSVKEEVLYVLRILLIIYFGGLGIGVGLVLLHSITYVVEYWGDWELRREYTLWRYWKEKTLPDLKKVPLNMLFLLLVLVFFPIILIVLAVKKVRSGGGSYSGSGGGGDYSGGGGSFGGGGGGSDF